MNSPTQWGEYLRNHYWWHYFWPGNWGNPMFTFEDLSQSSSISLIIGMVAGMAKIQFHDECY